MEAAAYLTDLEYTGHFYPFLAPAQLAYTAAVSGYRTPSLEGFNWCELGCGKGITALLLAALHPGGAFHACDLNPDHIAYGEAQRRAAGVDNLKLYANSVGQMLQAELPAFDFIVMHGLYGWVPEAVREEIHAFLRRFLKPGGLVFASYNALPGWAALQPLGRMMRFFAQAESGDSAAKARHALARLQDLADQGAAYFRDTPAAAERLAEMAGQDLRYLAHEYLTPHGAAFHFADVAERMAGIGLAYAGSTTPRHNYAELMAPRRFETVLATARSRPELETLRDFIVNTHFRRDVYTAQPAAPGGGLAPLAPGAFAGLAFRLTDLPEKLRWHAAEDDTVGFDLRSEQAAVAAVHARLLAGPSGAQALAEMLETDVLATQALIEKLVLAGHIEPCPPPVNLPGWPRINRILVAAALAERLPEIPLACPAAASAIRTDTAHAAALDAVLEHDGPDAAAQALLTRLRGLGQRVHRRAEDGSVEAVDDAALAAYVAELWHELRDPESTGAGRLRLHGLLPAQS
jgi:SAM-dependent methyltransferase